MNILLRDQAGEIAFNAFYPDATPLATHVTDGQDLWEDKGERTADETPIFAFCDGAVEAAFQLDPEGIKNAKESPESVETTKRLEAANAEVVIPDKGTELQAGLAVDGSLIQQLTQVEPKGATNDESKA